MPVIESNFLKGTNTIKLAGRTYELSIPNVNEPMESLSAQGTSISRAT